MPKVLIVDDEEDILWGLSEELSRNGIDVDTASNGQEAFEKIKENDYDFLITDIRMPGMSGSELLLKSKNLRPDLKVVVMTAYGSDELKQEVLSHGAISYLEKPFDFEQLLELIKEKGKKVDETISKLSLNQFMQLVSMEGQSCTITVKTDEGEGKVYFIDGEVVNAEFQNFLGEEAFIKIMKFQKPAFEVDWGVPQTKRMIEKPLHALLLAAVAKKEEEEAGVSGSEELSEEVDLSALSKLFGEDEGVSEEAKEEGAVEEEVAEEKGAAEEAEGGMEIDLEGISFEDEGVVEEEEVAPEVKEEEAVEEEAPVEEEEEFSIENIESMLEEEVAEGEEKEEIEAEEEKAVEEEKVEEAQEEGLEEEFSLENLESLLEEEVSEEEEVKEEVPTAKEEAEEEKSEEVSLESLEEELEGLVEEPQEKKVKEEEVAEESVVEEGVVAEEVAPEVKEEEAPVEEVVKAAGEEIVEEEAPAEEVAERSEEVKEEAAPQLEEVAPTGEVVKQEVSEAPAPVEKKGAPVISEDKRSVAEDVLRKIVALTTDIHAGFIADINGNIVASQFKTGSVKGEGLGYLGEYVGMMFEILKQVTGEDIEDITVSLKSENLIAAPALDGNLAIFVVTTKRTMKLALIKVELKKAVAKLKEELS